MTRPARGEGGGKLAPSPPLDAGLDPAAGGACPHACPAAGANADWLAEAVADWNAPP